MRSDYSVQQSENGFALLAGGGVDVNVTPALTVRVDNAGSLKVRLVLTQFRDHILPVHTCKCAMPFRDRQEADADSMG